MRQFLDMMKFVATLLAGLTAGIVWFAVMMYVLFKVLPLVFN